jgi:DNA helicase-2/ATP-dependent DNA helicase PcrA
LGIKPDFGVYDQDSDREALLKEALEEASERGKRVSSEDVKWLKTIDELRSALVSPEKTAARFLNKSVGDQVALVYSIYEEALRDRNLMDFNGMILNACRLAHKVPATAARIRQSYRYWLIDEFQDTSPAQYRLIRFLAGDDFRNIFVVADDDQIIYQWAGASYKQISEFRKQFSPELIQLVENRRCPPEVVKAANNLVSHNTDRTPGKIPLTAAKSHEGPAISQRVYANDVEESQEVAKEIAATGPAEWGDTAVLGRTRAILLPILEALRALCVKSLIVIRRDRFISPQFVWLQSSLDQSIRPTDKRVFKTMVDAANRISGIDLDPALLIAEAEAAGNSFAEYWASSARQSGNGTAEHLGELLSRLVQSRAEWSKVVREALSWLPETAGSAEGIVTDAADDKAAWDKAVREIRAEKGGDCDLGELLQGLALRPKEPPPDPSAVSLFTIHSAKGLEFKNVWVVGLAETILPSWQSLQPKAHASALEEERRNCFVAITRTRQNLLLSHANEYRGYRKQPSRFLSEMGLS